MPPPSNAGPSLIPGQQAIFSPLMHPSQTYYQLLHPSLPASPMVTRCNQLIYAPSTYWISCPQLKQHTSFPAWRRTPSSPLSQCAMPDAWLPSPKSTAPLYTVAAQLCAATIAPALACGWCPSSILPSTKQQAQLLLPNPSPHLPQMLIHILHRQVCLLHSTMSVFPAISNTPHGTQLQ